MAPTRTPEVIAAWIQCTAQALDEQDPELMYDVFMTNLLTVFQEVPYPALHKEVCSFQYNAASDYEKMIANALPNSDSMKSLVRAMAAYLWYLESAHPNLLTQRESGYQQQLKTYYQRMLEFLQALIVAFGESYGAVLGVSVAAASKWIIVVDESVNDMFRQFSSESGEKLIGTILTAFHSASGERVQWKSPTQLCKRSVAIDLANQILKLQTKLCSTSLSSALFQAIENFDVPLEFPWFKHGTLCTYYYYRAKDMMYDKIWVKAHRALQKSYDLCHPTFYRHRQKILIPLLATGAIVGRFPTDEIFSRPESEGLGQLFIPLCKAVQKGDFRAFRYAMGIEGPDKWKAQFWERYRLHHILPEYLHILIWRSLIRKVYLITAPAPPEQQKRPTIKIRDLWACAHAMHVKAPEDIDQEEFARFAQKKEEDPLWDVEDPTTWWYGGLKLTENQVEGVIMSLMSHRLVKGYIARNTGGVPTVLVLSKTDPIPTVWSVYSVQSPEEVKGPKAVGGGRVVRLSGVKAIGE